MIYLDKYKDLFNILNIDSFSKIQDAISNIAPSMLEYHLEELLSNIESNINLNRHNIQETINLDAYTLYVDYSDNIYIEQEKVEDEYATSSLW